MEPQEETANHKSDRHQLQLVVLLSCTWLVFFCNKIDNFLKYFGCSRFYSQCVIHVHSVTVKVNSLGKHCTGFLGGTNCTSSAWWHILAGWREEGGSNWRINPFSRRCKVQFCPLIRSDHNCFPYFFRSVCDLFYRPFKFFVAKPMPECYQCPMRQSSMHPWAPSQHDFT